jgi:deoxyribonuclease V
VVTEDSLESVKYVAGVDVAFDKQRKLTQAAVAVLEFPSLTLCAQATAMQRTAFPYVPGLLSFREVPAILEALAKVDPRPDLLLCDGQGLAHPRRFGLACHLGVLTGVPSIGVAKTRLIGHHGEVPGVRGRWAPLVHQDETLGAVVRTRTGVKPIFVSIGHRISLLTAVAYVMRCTTRYRLPETTRQAHRLAAL